MFDIGNGSCCTPGGTCGRSPDLRLNADVAIEHIPRAGGRYRGAGRRFVRSLSRFQGVGVCPPKAILCLLLLADLAYGRGDGWGDRGVKHARNDVARIQLVRRDPIRDGICSR